MKRTIATVALLTSLFLPIVATAGEAVVNVNTADTAKLTLLYRVGAVIAQRIVDERTENGPYSDLSNLQERVKGIGEVWVACNGPYVAFEGDTTLEAKAECAAKETAD